MSSFFNTLSPEIVWVLVGIVLVFTEFFIPGLVIAFFGVGALVTALTTWIKLTGTLASQLLVFIISSLLFLILLRKSVKNIFLGKTSDKENERDFNVEIGKIVPVVELIQPGQVGGKVRYQGTLWSASATEPVAPGESVEIIGRENLTLIVEKVKE